MNEAVYASIWENQESISSPLSYGKIVGQAGFYCLGWRV